MLRVSATKLIISYSLLARLKSFHRSMELMKKPNLANPGGFHLSRRGTLNLELMRASRYFAFEKRRKSFFWFADYILRGFCYPLFISLSDTFEFGHKSKQKGFLTNNYYLINKIILDEDLWKSPLIATGRYIHFLW
ncbi:MAG: hypothetical protein AAFW70_03170 [Cyanobacteria bacterium J06635_10]